MIIFEWDKAKEALNIAKHDVSFSEACLAFDDDRLVIIDDEKHSQIEPRLLVFGVVHGRIMTVRCTRRGDTIRIIGAAYWRKGKKIYDKENKKNAH